MKKIIILLTLFFCISASMICCSAYENIFVPFSNFKASGFNSNGTPQHVGASISKSIDIPADGYYVAVFNATSSRGTSDAGNLYVGSFRANVPIYRTAIYRSAQDNLTRPFFVKKGTYNLDFICHDTDIAISSITIKYAGKGYDQIEKAIGAGNSITYRVNAPSSGFYDIRMLYYCSNGCDIVLDGENIKLPATRDDYFSIQVRHYLKAGEQDIAIQSINGLVYTQDLTITLSDPIVVPATFEASRLEGGFKAYIKDAIGNRTIDTVCGIVDGGYADYTVVAKTAGTYWLSVAYSARVPFVVNVKVNNNEHAFSVTDTKEIDWQWSSQMMKITLNEGENKIRVYNSTPNDLRIYYLEINNEKRTYDENLGKECYIEPITIYTDKGVEPYLPAALTYHAADGNIVTRRISWNRVSPDFYATDGVFYVDGNPEELNTLVLAKVIVGTGNRSSNTMNPVKARIKGSGLWSGIPAEAEVRLYNHTEHTKNETVFLCVYENDRLESVKSESFKIKPFSFEDVIMETNENITSPDTQKVRLFVWNSDGSISTDFQGDTLQGAASGLPVLGVDPPLMIAQSMTNEEKANILIGHYYGRNNVSGTIRSIPRFGIKEMLLPDGPSGLRMDGLEDTVYPVRYASGFNQASSWDPKISFEIGRGLGYQGASNDIALLLGPGMNIHRSIFNGRNFEYYSEDPYLTGVQAAAYVDGMQGVGMGATIKHFAANNAEAWRGSASSNMSERALREIYLKGFELVVRDAQPWGVMTAYNGINGEHTSHNVDLIANILRNEWGYKYLTMSDWWGYRDTRLTLNAGNITMPDDTGRLADALNQINAGTPNLKNMNEGIAGIVRTAEKTTHYNKYFTSHDANSTRLIQVARETGADTMVLLKNEDKALPMAAGSKVALFGHGAVHTVYGGLGSGVVYPQWEYNYTDGLSKIYQLNSTIYNKYANLPGYDTNNMDTANPVNDNHEITISVQEAQTAAKESEYAIIVISRYTVEGVDHDNRPGDYYLSEREYDLIYKVSNAFHAQGKKVAVVLNVTFPMEIMSWRDSVDAILLAGFLSQEPGLTLGDVLCGDVTPSGKLPNTWPTTFESTPTYNNPYGNYSDITYIDDIYVGYRYYETFDVPVAYEFGYGLSYTNFAYSDATMNGTLQNGDLTFNATVTNTGDVPGKEVVQVYGNMPDGILEHASKELVAYGKTKLLQPGESETLSLTVDLLAIKAYDTENSRWYLEEGEYTWFVGASVRDIKYTFTTKCNDLVVLEDVNNECEPHYSFPTATKDTIDLVGMPNIAAGKSISCFSNEASNPAHHAVDGDYLTRWARGGAEGGTNYTWLQVDLEINHLVNRIILLYEASCEDIMIKYSQDGNTWYTYTKAKGNGKDIQMIDTNFVGRYVRIYFDCSRYASVYELIINGKAFHLHQNNAALLKPVTATKIQDGTGMIATNITDGDLSTRWAASIDGTDSNRYAIVDLEKVMPLHEFVIYWESTNGTYSIETATDKNGSWTEIFKNTSGHHESGSGAAVRFYDGKGINTRYIRINGSAEAYFSIYELVVLSPTENLALGKKAMASSSEKGYVPSNANDGYSASRWSGFNSALAPNSNGTYDWWQVDLEEVYDISQIGLFWENHSMRDYYVAVSETQDGPWIKVISNDEANNAVVNVSCKARFVRVYMTRETYHSLTEVQVFGK